LQGSEAFASATSTKKKGVGVWYFSGVNEAVASSGAGWVYDWTSTPGSQDFTVPSGVEFVPQVTISLKKSGDNPAPFRIWAIF
jgi:hypothetical protein